MNIWAFWAGKRALRPWLSHWFAAHGQVARKGAVAAVATALLLPVAGAPLLRFDRDPPQPELRRLGNAAAAFLQPGDRLALFTEAPEGVAALGPAIAVVGDRAERP